MSRLFGRLATVARAVVLNKLDGFTAPPAHSGAAHTHEEVMRALREVARLNESPATLPPAYRPAYRPAPTVAAQPPALQTTTLPRPSTALTADHCSLILAKGSAVELSNYPLSEVKDLLLTGFFGSGSKFQPTTEQLAVIAAATKISSLAAQGHGLDAVVLILTNQGGAEERLTINLKPLGPGDGRRRIDL